MPLLKIHTLGKEQAWAVWRIAESEDKLTTLVNERCPADVVNSQKRLEWLAARALTKQVINDFGHSYVGIDKNEFGKPFLKNNPHHISLSHSYPFVMVQVDLQQNIGIDLEQPKEKLRTVAKRVFSVSEVADGGNDIIKLCVYWCAKEALYKIHGKRNLLFTDHLKVDPFKLLKQGYLTGKIVLNGLTTVVRLQYLVENEYVAVYTSPEIHLT